jgi:hypothetical protein
VANKGLWPINDLTCFGSNLYRNTTIASRSYNFEDLITKQVSSSLIGRAIGLSENPLIGSTHKRSTAWCTYCHEPVTHRDKTSGGSTLVSTSRTCFSKQPGKPHVKAQSLHSHMPLSGNVWSKLHRGIQLHAACLTLPLRSSRPGYDSSPRVLSTVFRARTRCSYGSMTHPGRC